MAEKIKTFKEKWLAAVKDKGSILCAGLDPAEAAMGRGEKGLPRGVNKLDWSLRYIDAVAPCCAALKPNLRYWLKPRTSSANSRGDMENLERITTHAHNRGLIVIQDSKEPDIGSTNDAGLYHGQGKKVDAITLALFAGNMQEAAEQLRNRGLGGIHMCIMSNPDYEREKNKLVLLKDENEEGEYRPGDIVSFGIRAKFVHQYIQLAHDAAKFGIDGLVIGAPSKSDSERGIKGNHIKEYEIERVSTYFQDGLILVPGVGTQGGDADILFKYFNPDHLIVSESRSLMLPSGSDSTPKQQAEAAKKSRDILNNLRTEAA